MRASRENEILVFLSLRREGFTWKELLGEHIWTESEVFTGKVIHGKTVFPRQTLAKHLKSLKDKGLVEKIWELRELGKRGRPRTRYRIPSKYWTDLGCLSMSLPARKLGSAWFIGKRIHRRTGKGKNPEHIRLLPEEKKKYDELKAWLKERRKNEVVNL